MSFAIFDLPQIILFKLKLYFYYFSPKMQILLGKNKTFKLLLRFYKLLYQNSSYVQHFIIWEEVCLCFEAFVKKKSFGWIALRARNKPNTEENRTGHKHRFAYFLINLTNIWTTGFQSSCILESSWELNTNTKHTHIHMQTHTHTDIHIHPYLPTWEHCPKYFVCV